MSLMQIGVIIFISLVGLFFVSAIIVDNTRKPYWFYRWIYEH